MPRVRGGGDFPLRRMGRLGRNTAVCPLGKSNSPWVYSERVLGDS